MDANFRINCMDAGLIRRASNEYKILEALCAEFRGNEEGRAKGTYGFHSKRKASKKHERNTIKIDLQRHSNEQLKKKGKKFMNILVTGGAGFIGRWLVKKLLEKGDKVWIMDNFSNGSKENIKEFINNPNLVAFIEGDIKDTGLLEKVFENNFHVCYHLAASINVQDSIDDPKTTFENDTIGTFNVLEQCKKHGTKVVFMSTCMVYDRANDESGITETHPTKPASPYAGSKIAGENMVLSYWYAYKHPVVVIRPFNTYGPMQKTNSEGGVISIFIQRNLKGETLNIYGDGNQTRDLLYVEDCVNFIIKAGESEKANGQIINAGTGKDVTINELASKICKDSDRIKHIEHIHPQSEIQKLVCNSVKAHNVLSWSPEYSLEEGIKKTEDWIKENL